VPATSQLSFSPQEKSQKQKFFSFLKEAESRESRRIGQSQLLKTMRCAKDTNALRRITKQPTVPGHGCSIV